MEKRFKVAKNSDSWTHEHAVISIEAAQYDLGVARGALADGNAPGFERAMARAEAYFIEADPSQTEVENENLKSSSPQGHTLSYNAEEDEVAFVDLTFRGEEE